MKLSCLQENLKRALGVVNRAVKERTPLPITKTILLSAEQTKLRLASTNLEISISCQIPAEVETDGSLCVPAKEFIDLVETFPQDVVYLEGLPKERLSIECGGSRNKLHGLRAEDFPSVPKVTGFTFEMRVEELKVALNRLSTAIAEEESRPVLTGLNTKLGVKGIVLASTDGFQLAVEKISTPPIEEFGEITIPRATIFELSKLLQDESVKITIGRGQILFQQENIELVSQLLMGQYPNYESLLRSDFSTKAEVLSSSLLGAVRRAFIVSKQGVGDIKVEIKEDKVIVSAKSEVGESESEVEAEVSGNPLSIALNSKYLIKALERIGSEKITLCGVSPNHAFYITPVGSGDYIYLMMPMMR